MEATSGVVPTDGDDGRDQAPTISNEHGRILADDERETLLATSMRTPAPSVLDDGDDDDRDHGRPRIGLVAMVLAGVVFVGGGVLFGMRWVQMSVDPAAATEPAAPTGSIAASATTPAESESAIVIGGVQRTPPGGNAAAAAAQGGAGAGAGTGTGTFTGTATGTGVGGGARGGAATVSSGTRTRVGTAGTATTPPHDDCDNPFTVDSRGIRHPKPQCFNKK
jgi:hypothetical protein